MASRLFAQAFVQAQIEENIKAPRHWPLWGESTGDRWISCSKWRVVCTGDWVNGRLCRQSSRLNIASSGIYFERGLNLFVRINKILGLVADCYMSVWVYSCRWWYNETVAQTYNINLRYNGGSSSLSFSLYVYRSCTLLVTLQWRHNGPDGVSNHQPHDCSLNGLFRRRSKKTSKLRVTGLCAGDSPVTGEFPTQRASNKENVSIRWRHPELCGIKLAVRPFYVFKQCQFFFKQYLATPKFKHSENMLVYMSMFSMCLKIGMARCCLKKWVPFKNNKGTHC